MASATQYANQTFYIVDGYWKPRPAADPASRYELDKFGDIIAVDGDHCAGFGQARKVLNARYLEELPDPILRQLANDLAAHLVRAAGSPDRLRAQLRNRRINDNTLPTELQQAFKAFFPH